MKATTLGKGFLSCVVALALVGIIGAITPAFATGVVCGNLCRAVIRVSGVQLDAPVVVDARGVGHASLVVPPGGLNLGGLLIRDFSATLNPDPAIIFSLNATNVTGAPLLVSGTFFTPILLSGTISAGSSISYSLTDGFPAGLGGSPGVVLSTGLTTDPNHVLVAFDTPVFFPVLPPPLGAQNKGVDVGPFVNDVNPTPFTPNTGGIPGICSPFTNAAGASTSGCGPFSATNTFVINPGNLFMEALVNFNLSAQDSVAMTGSVVENPVGVPEPASLLLMGSGLLGLVAGWRRYSLRA